MKTAKLGEFVMVFVTIYFETNYGANTDNNRN